MCMLSLLELLSDVFEYVKQQLYSNPCAIPGGFVQVPVGDHADHE